MDMTTTFRPGTRQGPHSIRVGSQVLEEYSMHLKRDLSQVGLHDRGDLPLPLGEAEPGLEMIKEVVDSIASTGKMPVMLGGEHLVTLGAVWGLSRHYPDLVVIQVDAHADLRHDYSGVELSHDTVMRRVSEALPARSIYQFGVRSATEAEVAYAQERTHMYPVEVLEPYRRVKPGLKDRPVYLTVDIDVVDPAFAPGTGAPEPGGIDSREILQFARETSGLCVVGFDIVEVAPAYDSSQRTSILAAAIVREILLALTDAGGWVVTKRE